MYQVNFEDVNTLSQVHCDDDIKQLSHGMFPGTHCPLFGALMVASYIKGMAVLNVGTEECTFYGKDFSYRRQKGKDFVYSMVTTKRDITFGFQEKLIKTIHELVENEKPEALLVISTCVVELIGEDVTAIVSSVQDDLSIPIFSIKTEHFKCNSHIPGISDTLEHFTKLMKEQPTVEKSVNILGHRYEGFDKTELNKILKDNDIHVNMSIPSKTSVKALELAPSAALNIVTDFSAIALAEAMKEKFQIPYVVFEKYLSPLRISESYAALATALDIDIDEFVQKETETLNLLIKTGREKLKGKTFIYGNTPFKALEISEFLSQIGMIPLWVQLRELYEDDALYKDELLSKEIDPKISRIANIIPMRAVYDAYQPDAYIGHENPMELMRRGIKQITFDKEGSGLGFELTKNVIEKLVDVFDGKRNAGMMRPHMHHPGMKKPSSHPQGIEKSIVHPHMKKGVN